MGFLSTHAQGTTDIAWHSELFASSQTRCDQGRRCSRLTFASHRNSADCDGSFLRRRQSPRAAAGAVHAALRHRDVLVPIGGELHCRSAWPEHRHAVTQIPSAMLYKRSVYTVSIVPGSPVSCAVKPILFCIVYSFIQFFFSLLFSLLFCDSVVLVRSSHLAGDFEMRRQFSK